MNEDFVVRKACKDDSKDFIDLVIELQEFNYKNAIKRGDSKQEAGVNLVLKKNYDINNFASWLNNLDEEKKSMVFMAFDTKNKAIGFISAEIEYKKELVVGKIGYISDLYVKKEYRAKGIASVLMEKTLDWFKKMKVNHVSLDVDMNNEPAIKLYSKFGFNKKMFKMSYCKI
jgi:ribosomal protein S18 acetylase RimI-like enzyme